MGKDSTRSRRCAALATEQWGGDFAADLPVPTWMGAAMQINAPQNKIN
jgi:hypothetical protein